MIGHCEDCKYWEEVENFRFDTGLHRYLDCEKLGDCHRFPKPEPKKDKDWCGEFEPKPKVETEKDVE